VYQESQGLKACVDAQLEAGRPLQPGERCFSYRAIGGVSMGGGSAARIGFHYPELFDTVGVMGTPFADFDYFFNMLKTNHLSGFCTYEQLMQVLQTDPAMLNDPAAMNVWCGTNGNMVPGDLAVPDSQCWAFRSDFNHYWRGPDPGRGGSFKRTSLLEIMQDIFSTYGNPNYYNPENPYMPPGVPLSRAIPPGLPSAERNMRREQSCANPVVLNNFKHAYNPEGTFPVITFCDCTACDDNVIPTANMDNPVDVLLAVDYNRNGKRDYGEPVLFMGSEPYRDFGADGKDTGEVGNDPMDDFDPYTNITGLAHNARYDEGEPYDDVGLDGVANSGDYGEGDGLFTMAPNLERALNDSPTRWFDQMSDNMARRLDVWMDAGIRDFINSAQITNRLFAAIKRRDADARLYHDFADLADLAPGEGYLMTSVDFSPQSMGRNAYLLYGNPSFCPGIDAVDGDGNHVGRPNQVVDRLLTLFGFVDARMPGGDRSFINAESAADDHPDGFLAHLKLETYASQALGRPQEYGLVLPPGYFYDFNATKRYPVIYFLHGQGQNARDMVALGAIFMGYMFQSADSSVLDRSDMQKFILVFADGECQGSECFTGNFYSNFVGRDGNGPQFETAFLELMRHIDANYRTRLPEVH